MSEDEVKPQSEEPTPEAVTTEEDVKKEKEVKKVEEEDEEENDKVEDEDTEMEEVKEEKKEVKEEKKELKEEKKEVKEEKKVKKVKPQKEKVSTEEVQTPEKDSGVPLYDQPLELCGKRDRKKVERFIQEEKKEELKFEGTGTPLGEIPFIDAMITKIHHDDLKFLHRVAYSRPGSGHEIKKNLRKFNGFAFDKEDKKFELKTISTEKVMKIEITKALQALGLERSGSKREVVDRLLDFMLKPEDLGKAPPTDKKKKGKGRGRPKKGLNESKNDSNISVSDADSAEEMSSVEEKDDSDEEVEEKEEKEVKKPKKTPAKKTPAKKTPAKRPAPAKKSASAKKPAKKSAKVSTVDSDSESDDEPLAKKVKQPPTDGEIKAMVKKILDGANLEEVTMKSVCRQVYDSYPDFDLTHKKDFIKETVKSIIS